MAMDFIALLSLLWKVIFGELTWREIIHRNTRKGLSLSPRSLSEHLPPREHVELFGRAEELANILDLLRPYPKSRFHIVSIQGLGGVGKSALALEVAHRIRERHASIVSRRLTFDAIVWASAKPTILTPDGEKPRPHHVSLLEDVFREIAITLGKSEITHAPRDMQASLVYTELAKQKVLLILDNMETIDDESLIAFVKEVPDPTKVIITSRHSLSAAVPINLEGLQREPALELIFSESRLRRDRVLGEDTALDLWRRTGGIPLAIVWTLGRMRLGFSSESVLAELSDPQSDISKFCFQKSVESLRSTKAYELLCAASMFRDSASTAVVGYICDLHESKVDLENGLIKLEQLCLITTASHRHSMAPLARTYVREILDDEVLRSRFSNRYVDYYVQFIRDQVGEDYWDGRDALQSWLRFSPVVEELDHIRDAINFAYAARAWSNVLALVKGVIHILWAKDLYQLRIELSCIAVEAARKLGRKVDEAWLHVDALGFILKSRGDYKEALASIEKGMQIAETIGNPDIKVLGYCFRAEILDNENRTEEALRILESAEALPAGPRIRARLESTKALIEKFLSERQPRSEQNTGARKQLRRATEQTMRLLQQATSSRLSGEYLAAKQKLLEAQGLENMIGDMRLRALIQMENGLLEMRSGDFERGTDLLKDAQAVFQHLRMNDDASRINQAIMSAMQAQV